MEVFEREILPRLAHVPPAAVAEATGLSVAYCRRVKRGLVVPHPMRWEVLKRMAEAG